MGKNDYFRSWRVEFGEDENAPLFAQEISSPGSPKGRGSCSQLSPPKAQRNTQLFLIRFMAALTFSRASLRKREAGSGIAPKRTLKVQGILYGLKFPAGQIEMVTDVIDKFFDID
ncbi:hypothetical protein AARAC_012027 [Aspergillus arachidicola]|uniref:Uncharacterized protein n=1 Tax=Aspergillus arachidicola TaxID=656916 RepID=A0A2G7FKB2_9EURO|nr:hypothetical protein AARAC_012027 [Aspergillus arachidicola]